MQARYALSVRQPWAWLITYPLKDVENRTWALPAWIQGQRIYIHAGVKVDWNMDIAFILDRLPRDVVPVSAFLARWRERAFATGALVGEATVLREARPEESRWYEGPHGFLLRDATAYEKPIPCKGQLGFFKVEPR